MHFSYLPECEKEFYTLLKKWRSLKNDIEILKKVLQQQPEGHPPGIIRISDLKIKTEIYKVKHFRCSDMKGKGSHSGIRVIYAYLPEKDKIEFVEIYYKEKDDRDCDRNRIRKYYT